MMLRICFILLILPHTTYGQWRGPQFDTFGAQDGLHSDDIRAIVQDRIGYLYFGGYQQLIRYDGRNFEDFTHDPADTNSIGPGQISRMVLTTDGKIALSMRRDGLNIFDPETETFNRYAAPVTSNATDPIIEDENGNIWLGADDFKLLKFDRKSLTFTSYSPEKDFPSRLEGCAVTGIVQDIHNRDILWISAFEYDLPAYPGRSAYTLAQFDRRSGTFTVQPCAGNAMYQDDKGRIWSGSWSSGVWRYNPILKECENLRFEIQINPSTKPGDGVFAIHPVTSGYWIGSRNAMLSITDQLDDTFVFKDADIGGINSFCTDHSGNTWIGTTNGLRVLHPGSQHIDFFSLSTFGNTGRIYPGRLAYHPVDSSIYLINRNEHRLYRIPLDHGRQADFVPTPFAPSAVAIDHNGRILVAGESALYTYTPVTREFASIRKTLPNGENMSWLWSMDVDDDGWIIGVGPTDFFWFKDEVNSFHHKRHQPFAPEQSAHSRIFKTGDQKVLLSGSAPMYEVDLATGVEIQIQAPDRGHLVKDHAGMYWLGTINHIGQYQLSGDRLKLVRYFTAKDGLSNITASHLHVDGSGRIWIFSNNGMSVIDPVTYQTRNIGVPEGLPLSAIDPVQVIDLPDGRMSTVNSHGIIVFHPDSLWNATTPSDVNVVIKHVRINGNKIVFQKEINTLDQIELASDQRTIDIQFQGLAFPHDRHVTYSYQVRGLHEDWISLGKNNSVTLSELPPGSYIFRVKAGESESAAPVKEFGFTIAAPLYQTAWFVLLCMTLLMSMIIVAYRWRIAQVRRQEEEKMKVHRQIAELELQALRAQMNPHFMFNSLNSIKNYILKNETAKAAQYLSSFAHLIRLILQHTREKTISLKDELETLLLYIDLEKLRFRDGFEFTCKVDERMDTIQLQIPPMILQPYVENAIWHGLLHKESDRLLALRISYTEMGVLCEVEDNGIGRTQAAMIKSKSATRYKSMGMGITQDRITLMNSMNALGIAVDIIDKINAEGEAAGTLVKIYIPNASYTDR